jgi:hypothetical protein
MFFEKAWVQFGILRSIIPFKDTSFVSTFQTPPWEKMDIEVEEIYKFPSIDIWVDISSK